MSAIFALLPIVYRINSAVGTAIVDTMHPNSLRKVLHNMNVICNILLGSTRWYVNIPSKIDGFFFFFSLLFGIVNRIFFLGRKWWS